MKKTLILIMILTAIWSCKDSREFPQVKNLSEYKETEFLPTLETNISKDKNSVYCATLLFAWDEIRKNIDTPLEIDSQYTDLIHFNNSKSFRDVLEPNEYNSGGEIENGQIMLNAEFEKSLPFLYELTSYDNKLLFNQTKVASFGTMIIDEKARESVQILYYKNDEEFVIRLSLLDSQHEIVLYKSETKFKTISEIITTIQKNIVTGKNEMYNEPTAWKYNLFDQDEVIIPKFSFNIETNFSALENNSFKSGGQPYTIETAKQKTAFLMDEKGAEIESFSIFIAKSTDEVFFSDTPHPKKLVFNKPFFLMIKRTDNIQPYFALFINNTELMVKE